MEFWKFIKKTKSCVEKYFPENFQNFQNRKSRFAIFFGVESIWNCNFGKNPKSRFEILKFLKFLIFFSKNIFSHNFLNFLWIFKIPKIKSCLNQDCFRSYFADFARNHHRKSFSGNFQSVAKKYTHRQISATNSLRRPT